MFGKGFTVTVSDAVFLQLFALVPVTVYTVVDDGLADVLVAVGADNESVGLHT